MKLPFYILRRYIISLVMVSGFVLTLVFLIDLVNQLAQFSSDNITVQQVFVFCILRLSDNFLLFLPLIVLLAALFCFLGLARTSEIVVIRAVGVPATRFVFIPVVFVFFFAIAIVTILNPLFVEARVVAQNYENQFIGRPDGSVSLTSANGVWLRTQGENRSSIIRLDQVSLEQGAANNITIYTKDAQGNISEITGNHATFADGVWTIENAERNYYGETIERTEEIALQLSADRDFDKFFSDYFSPRFILNRNLPDYIQTLSDDGYDTNGAKGYFYQQLALPLSLVSLCLVGAIFALAPQRMGGVTKRVFLAIGSGFLVYAMARVSESLGVAGAMPVWLSVIAIPIPAFFVAMSILLKQEDG